MRPTSRNIRFPAPAGFPVSGEPLGSSLIAVPRPFRSEFILPWAFVPIQSPTAAYPLHHCSLVKLLPWGFVPLRDINYRYPYGCRLPKAHIDPSSAFHTLSMVFSTSSLAGLFHPAATSRVLSSGVFPLAKPYHLVDGRALMALAPTSCFAVAHSAPPVCTLVFRAYSLPRSVAASAGFSRRCCPFPS